VKKNGGNISISVSANQQAHLAAYHQHEEKRNHQRLETAKTAAAIMAWQRRIMAAT